jgi:hypothetical protein
VSSLPIISGGDPFRINFPGNGKIREGTASVSGRVWLNTKYITRKSAGNIVMPLGKETDN